MHSFVYSALPGKVFSIDNVADEIRQLGCRRALVLSTPQQAPLAADLAARLGDLSRRGLYRSGHAHSRCCDAAGLGRCKRSASRLHGCARRRIHNRAWQGDRSANRSASNRRATYAGSEATPILGGTDLGRKTTQRTLKVVIVYDLELSLTLPTPLSVASGMNAVAHAVEAVYSPEPNRVISLLAMEGFVALVQALPAIIAQPRSIGCAL